MEERATIRSELARSLRAAAIAATPLSINPTIRDLRPPAPPTRRDARLVPGYEILEEIGRGGMGIVYKARQVQLGRLVALKMLRSSSAGRDDLLRFRTEAEAVARLVHPNIVQIFEVGEADGQPYLSLEFVPGGSLDSRLDGKPLPGATAARLVRTLAEAIQHAHDHGIVHRDLKPANVLLQEEGSTEYAEHTERKTPERKHERARRERGHEAETGRSEELPPSFPSSLFSVSTVGSVVDLFPKITDFGLAKKLDEAGQTQAGEIIGTPSYMAPEQAEGRNREIGPATDVWALGCILYECLTGRAPFVGESLLETLEQVRKHDPPGPRRLCPGVPRDLEIICLKCLEKNATRRYGRAADLAADLGRFLAGEPIQARPVGKLERGLKWARRRPTAAALAAVSGLLVAVVVSAVPLHVFRLNAEVDEISAAMRKAHLDQERAALARECERQLADGRVALSSKKRQDLEQALVCFGFVQKRLGPEDVVGDEELTRLRQQAIQLQTQASQVLDRLFGSETARKNASRFLTLRDEAFFQLHHDLLGGLQVERPRAALEACQQALEIFPDLDYLSEKERRSLTLARHEVQLLLAEALARVHPDDPDRLREALRLVDETATHHGPRAAAHLRRARYLELLGDRSAASRERQLAAELPLGGPLDWFLRGQERLLAGNIRAALNDLDRALSEDDDLFWARLLRAIGLQRLRDAAGAREELTLCIRSRPKFAWPYLLRASLNVQAGRLETAAADLAIAGRLRLDVGGHYALLVNRGVLALARRHPRQAASEFQRAVFHSPGYYHAHVNLAQAYWQAGDLDRARAVLDHAISLEPGRAALYRTRARLLVQKHDLLAAAFDIGRARECEPSDRPARDQATDLREQARLLYLVRRYNESLPLCQQAVALQPDSTVGLRLLAEILLELGRFKEAQAMFDRYLKKNGKGDVEVYRRRARARAGAGDLTGVVEEYTFALSLERSAPLYLSRGWAQLVTGAARPALRDFETALQLGPPNAEALIGRGSARLELGEVKLAVADVEAGLRLGPRQARVLYGAARVLARAAGRQNRTLQLRSLEVLRKAVEAVPFGDRARYLKDQVRRDEAFRTLGRGDLDALERLLGSGQGREGHSPAPTASRAGSSPR